MEEVKAVQEKKIAIVGCSDSKDFAPFADKSWEIWGVNNLFFHIPRWDRWFEIHNITKDQDGNWMRRGNKEFRGQNINAYVADLAKMKCPVYMQQHWDEIPTSTPYPLEQIKFRFGSILGWINRMPPDGLDDDRLNRQLYGTNTVTYMILLAIFEGATHIGVWGVDMAVDTEYHFQRPSCEWALGIAQGLGIQVYIPPQADLLKVQHLYGFEEKLNDEWTLKVNRMRESMQKRGAKANADLEQSRVKVERCEGALRLIAQLRAKLGDKITPEIAAELNEAETGLKPERDQNQQLLEKAYAANQQYIGAMQAANEMYKIWGSIR